MAVYDETLATIRGRVKEYRPDASSLAIDQWINDRIRDALNARTYWADLITQGILVLPDMYTTGTVSVTKNSKIVTGVATAWPVSDVVNTTLAADTEEIGYVEITPTAMTGITNGALLYIGTGATAEVCPVVYTTRTTFTAKCANLHLATQPITQSSLAGLQFRLNNSDPIFTVNAVHTTTELELNIAWGNASRATQTYRILKMYVTLGSDLKEIVAIKDEQYGRPCRIHVSIDETNRRDPMRTSAAPIGTLSFVDLGPNDAGMMMYEVWPASTSARQISYLYYRQWPKLLSDNDVPPWFIEPSIFAAGATADALRLRKGKDDPYFNPQLAQEFEQKYLAGLERSKNNDDAKVMRAFDWEHWKQFAPGGANFWQAHDPDLYDWQVGGGWW